MTATLLALLTVAVLGALLSAVVLAAVVAPFVVTVDSAERRGLAAARWGAVAVGALLLGGLVVLAGLRGAWALLPLGLALPWAGPLLVRLAGDRWPGRPGAHER